MTHSATPAWPKIKSRWLFVATIFLAIGFAFWRLGDYGVRLWDETRYGEIALQMLQRGDFINYYFDNQMDDWVAKPPLGMWLIALAYKLVGFNEWALRLPSALAGITAVALTFLLVRLYKGALSATLACFAVITSRGILGFHVSRSGDLDALFVATALGSVYFMARYSRLKERPALLAAAICAGLCFLSKGFMLLLILPGLGIYLLLRGHAWPLLRDRYFWGGVAILAAFIFGWYACIHIYGSQFQHSQYGTDAWDVMINYDIRRRFTEKLEGDTTTPTFILEALDTRFSPWIYLLYLSLLVLLVRTKRPLGRLWYRLRHDDLLCLCTSMSLITCLVLANSATKFNWYIAITTPFLAVLTALLLRWAVPMRLFKILFATSAALGLAMQLLTVAKREDGLTDALIENLPLILGAKHIYATRSPAFNTVLALKWRNRKVDTAPSDLQTKTLKLIQPKLGTIQESDGFSVLLLPGIHD